MPQQKIQLYSNHRLFSDLKHLPSFLPPGHAHTHRTLKQSCIHPSSALYTKLVVRLYCSPGLGGNSVIATSPRRPRNAQVVHL